MSNTFKVIAVVLLVLVLGAIGYVFRNQMSEINSNTSVNNDNLPSTNHQTDNNTTTSATGATLAIDPASVSTAVGQTFSVDVVLDTQNNAVDGVDVYALTFDPAVLSVVDQDTAKSGVQLVSGTSLNISFTKVDQKAGKLLFSAVTKGGTTFNGKTVVATVKFKALKAGTSALKFDFTKGSSLDTNVASKGKDVLASVVNGSVTVK